MNKQRTDYQKHYWAAYKHKKKRVSFVLNPAEYHAFARLCEGQNVSAYIKALAIAGLAKQSLLPQSLQEELQTFNRLVRNIANNLNQLAHSAHIFREVDQKKVFEHLIELDRQVQDFVRDQVL
jgi:hypothetical protein